MSLRKVRFIQSGDWHLETPLGGVGEVPAELRAPFIDAPYLAAERVVQAALDHCVDFMLLTGNLLPIEFASPYSFEFLLRQFQRLADQGIAVYWLGAEHDDVKRWPAPLTLPTHVHLFPAGRQHQFDHRCDDQVVARLIGRSSRGGSSWRASDFAGADDTVPRVAVATGAADKRSLENKGIDYWALGGERRHHVLMQGRTTAAYAGSPQGRLPCDTDAHGAVLVELQYGKATTQFIETDLWRWRLERVQATELTSIDDLQAQMTHQLHQIPAEGKRFSSLLVWSAVCQGDLALQLSQEAHQRELLDSLQKLTENDARWTMAVETEPAELPEEWLEEDTVLGDFLRAVQRYEHDDDAWQALAPYLPETASKDQMLRELQDLSEEDRQRLWRRVAAWGADLLRGEVALGEATSVSV